MIITWLSLNLNKECWKFHLSLFKFIIDSQTPQVSNFPSRNSRIGNCRSFATKNWKFEESNFVFLLDHHIFRTSPNNKQYFSANEQNYNVSSHVFQMNFPVKLVYCRLHKYYKMIYFSFHFYFHFSLIWTMNLTRGLLKRNIGDQVFKTVSRCRSTVAATACPHLLDETDVNEPQHPMKAKPYSEVPGPKPLPILGNSWR